MPDPDNKQEIKLHITDLPEDVFLHYLSMATDLFSLLKLMQTCHFFSKNLKHNFIWKKLATTLLSEHPQLYVNESYYYFCKRHENFILKFKNLLSKNCYTSKYEIFGFLRQAIENNLDASIEGVLEEYPDFDINELTDKNGNSLAHIAILAKNTTALTKLIKYGVNLHTGSEGYMSDVRSYVKGTGLTPLQLAAQLDAKQCLVVLLSRPEVREQINFQNKAWNRTALHYAAECGHFECIKLLLRNGANSNLTDFENDTAFKLAPKRVQEEWLAFINHTSENSSNILTK